MELPAVGVGEFGEGIAIAGLGPSQHCIGHRFRFHHEWPPGGSNTKGAANSSLNPASARCFNCRRARQPDRRLTMAPVSPLSDLAEDRRRTPSPPPIAAPTPTQMAHVGSESAVRRWRAFALLVVAYFMTIVDLTIVNVALPTIGVKLHSPR